MSTPTTQARPRRRTTTLILAAVGAVAALVLWQVLGRFEHPGLREVSGIVKGRRFPGAFWVHNDSLNAPLLFAIRADGRVIRSFKVGAKNLDWEDVAVDDSGRLYLGDIGNNDRRLPVRAIYRLDEPDPGRTDDAPLPVTATTHYRFAPGGAFDAEGLFVDGGRAVLVAKTFDGREAALYAVPLDPPAPLLNPAVPEQIGLLPGFTEPATGADLSADGRRLAVCSLEVARVYERSESGGWTRIGSARYRGGVGGVEAICWDGEDLVLAGESGPIFRIPEATWRAGR